MILDLHAHSDASEDSRAPLETYLKWLQRKRDLLPIDGIVLTEHRQWDPTRDFRALEDEYGILVLGGVAAPCHPGRPTIGLCEHYEHKPPLEGVVAVEALNGGSRRGENERVHT